MATLTVVDSAVAGVDPGFAAAANGGDEFDNSSGNCLLILRNTGAGSRTATVAAQVASKTVGGYGPVAIANKAYAMSAGEDVVAGPFPKKAYNDADGLVQITYDDETDVELAVVRIP